MKTIIVREYLESLKEDTELDAIFPILLEAMGFQIISKPKETKGYQQYGKDVVAIGIDESDGIKKRFYFELKGGQDRDVTQHTYNKNDGIRMSVIEAKDRPFNHPSDPVFDHLPVKIILVHNGIIKENIREVFDGFVSQLFPANKGPVRQIRFPKIARLFGKAKQQSTDFQFERWDIYRLTELFATKLFNEYLLTDELAVQHFKKVLLLMNTPGNNNHDFKQLLASIFNKAGDYHTMGKRERSLLAETMKLIAFIVHSYARQAGNLEPARQCLDLATLAYWSWLLKNNVENDKEAVALFKNYVITYRKLMDEYIGRTLPVAKLPHGLWSPKGGRSEMIGYPMRAMAYLGTLLVYFRLVQSLPRENDQTLEDQVNDLIKILQANDATSRPLLDVHSIPLVLVLDFLIHAGRKTDAVNFLKTVWASIIMGYKAFGRLPDGNNSVRNVTQFMVRHTKSVYYADKTSHLLGILLEYTAVLDLPDYYEQITGFLKELNIDLAVFVPYDNTQLASMTEINEADHELALFNATLRREGYQSEIGHMEDFVKFKATVKGKKEFSFDYRTSKTEFSFLLPLAHVYFQTPLFPDFWRELIP